MMDPRPIPTPVMPHRSSGYVEREWNFERGQHEKIFGQNFINCHFRKLINFHSLMRATLFHISSNHRNCFCDSGL